MSKKAEKLAQAMNAARNQRIVDGIGKESRECGVYDPQYDVALIDAELRKERERCAEKLMLWPVGKGHSQEYRNGYMSALNRCTVILSEEE